MRKTLILFLMAMTSMAIPAQPIHGIQSVPFTNVHINDKFWLPRLTTLQENTIRYALQKCEESGYVRNFEIAGKIVSGELAQGVEKFQSVQPFDDAEVYKVIEGAAYILNVKEDAELEAHVDEVIDKICSAQEPDGYLQTNWTIHNPLHEWYGGKQWLNDWNLSHETFNIGELIEAGIAYYYATGKRKLLDAAIRSADQICSVFNENGIKMAPGHAVIEMALSRLYEATGDKKYIEECLFFLNCRGIRKFNPDSDDMRVNGKYWQDHLPAIEQREAVGHAVRALYFYSGMADIVRYNNDRAYLTAVDAIWDNIVGKKFYITGGLGAREVNEAFGDNYELPNARAYCETCASVANCMFNLRMFRLHGDAKYIDVLERSLYNNVLDGISETGDAYFYPNHLETSSRGQARSPWFGCSCCPTNLSRFVPSVPGYVFATDGKSIYANLYMGCTSTVDFNGKNVQLEETTEYPWDGDIKIRIGKTETGDFQLKVRIPGWAQGKPVPSDLYEYVGTATAQTTIKVNGANHEYKMENGYAVLENNWKEGDIVDIALPMEPRLVKSHDLVKDNAGRMAVERGPVVYCAEFADNGGKVSDKFIGGDVTFKTTTSTEFMKGMRIIDMTGKKMERDNEGKIVETDTQLRLVPYYARSHRGEGEMRVWLPTDGKDIAYKMDYIDIVDVKDEASERAHDFKGYNTNCGRDLGWRDAPNGWYSYKMKVDPNLPCDVVLTLWGSDGGGRRNFDLYVDGNKFATESVDNRFPYEYYDSRHDIPFQHTKGKTEVTIRLQAHPDNNAGGIFGIRTAVLREIDKAAKVEDFMETTEPYRSEHNYRSNGGFGEHRSHTWADGYNEEGISFDMYVSDEKQNYLILQFWGDEWDLRKFDIMADDEKLGTMSLQYNKPGFFFNELFPISKETTKGKNEVRIHLTSPYKTKVGGFFYAYTWSAENALTSIGNLTGGSVDRPEIHGAGSAVTLRNKSGNILDGKLSVFAPTGGKIAEYPVSVAGNAEQTFDVGYKGVAVAVFTSKTPATPVASKITL